MEVAGWKLATVGGNTVLSCSNATLDSTDESLSIISDGAGNWYIF